MIRKVITRPAIGLIALALLVVPLTGGTAGAVGNLPLVCTAAGTVLFQNNANTAWQLVGRGSCQGDLEGTYFLDFTGIGTSDSLGNCDAMNGGSVVPVTNLAIRIIGTLTNAADLSVKPVNQNWVAPLTTYPIATPFLVERGNGALIGAGVFFNHIFIQCFNSPVAQYYFTFLSGNSP
jgi:hypothetical protein